MIHLAKRIFLRDENVFENQFTGIGPSHTKFIKFASAGKALGGGVEDEGSNAFGSFFGLCLCIHNYVVGIWSLNEVLSVFSCKID